MAKMAKVTKKNALPDPAKELAADNANSPEFRAACKRLLSFLPESEHVDYRELAEARKHYLMTEHHINETRAVELVNEYLNELRETEDYFKAERQFLKRVADGGK